MSVAWLDLQFSERLAACPDCPDCAGGAELPAALRRFQMRALAASLEKAAAGSLFYRRRIGPALASALTARLREQSRACHTEAALRAELYAALDVLPLTSQAELAAAPDHFLAVSHSEAEGVISAPTSGSTGAVKRVYSSAADLENSVSFFQYGMRYLVSRKIGDRAALMMSGGRPGSVGALLGSALERLGIPFLAHGFPPSEEREEAAWLRELIAWRPSCLIGVPAQVLALARHELAPDLAAGLRRILLSGDVVPDALAAALSATFGAEVFKHYGLTEFGLGGAVECGERCGPHLREADLLVEILDERGCQVEPGARGEIVISSLSREAMPLIRYRTGDEGALLAAPCVCGSIMRRLLTFGRLADSIALPGGAKLSLREIAETLYALPFVRSFQASLEATGDKGRPVLRLDIKPCGKPCAAELEARARQALSSLPGLEEALVVEIGAARPATSEAMNRPGGKRVLRRPG